MTVRHARKQLLLTLLLGLQAATSAFSQDLPAMRPPIFPNTDASRPSLESTTSHSRSDNVMPSTDTVTSSLDIATYRLGPGDRLMVDVNGAYYARTQAVIAPDGTMLIEDVGSFPVAGLTLVEARKLIRSKVLRFFRNCDVTTHIIGVRRFYIEVLGQVAHPGKMEVSGTTRASAALLAAGGVAATGSERSIVLHRRGQAQGKGVRIDLVRYKLGLSTNDPTLEPGDILIVPSQGPLVRAYGQVRRPGSYELLPGEDLHTLLDLAGGFTAAADPQHVRISTLEASGLRRGENLDLSDARSSAWRAPLRDGDEVVTFNRTTGKDSIVVVGELDGKDHFEQTVNQLTGQRDVQRRARVPIYHGEGVREVVLALGGPTVKADQEHARIERTTPDGKVTQLEVNVRQLLANPSSPDVALQDGDTLSIPALEDSIYVIGEVGRPGPLPYTAGFGLRQYLTLAGGPTYGAATQHGRLVRVQRPKGDLIVTNIDVRALIEGRLRDDIRLQAGDILLVPRFHPFYRDVIEAIAPFVTLNSLFPNLRR